MNRKRVFILAFVIACVALAAVGTTAYETVVGTAVNIIEMGSVRFALHDETTGGKPFPKDGISGVVPDTQHDKVVYLENVGTADMYARIRLENSVVSKDGQPLPFENITLDIDTENWTEQDGYYYYNRKLAPGEKTEPLFTKVTFESTMGNEYKKCQVDIVVTAQAVQSRNNAEDPFTAEGWPAGAEEQDPQPDDTV